jgi:hypothetical protein
MYVVLPPVSLMTLPAFLVLQLQPGTCPCPSAGERKVDLWQLFTVRSHPSHPTADLASAKRPQHLGSVHFGLIADGV